jgi:hypothetical protein
MVRETLGMRPTEGGANAPAWGAGGCIPDRKRSGEELREGYGK